jgi:hypothetical protein
MYLAPYASACRPFGRVGVSVGLRTMRLGVTTLSQVAVNRGGTRADTSEHVRVYLPCSRGTFMAAANTREYPGIYAQLPCKRAVVSSILTGGSTKAQFTDVSRSQQRSRSRSCRHLPSTRFLAVTRGGGNRDFGPYGAEKTGPRTAFDSRTGEEERNRRSDPLLCGLLAPRP